MNLLIAGGGKFGKKAIEYAKKLNYRAILIDKNPNCFASTHTQTTFNNVDTLIKNFDNYNSGDMIFLNDNISSINKLLLNIQFEFIIPVVPIHLTAVIIKNYFNSFEIEMDLNFKSLEEITDKIDPKLLLDSIQDSATIYLSYAKRDEICPDNCSGPPNYCPNFDREKPITITNYLAEFFNVPEQIRLSKGKKRVFFLIKSYQLKAGLGGLKGEDISEVFKMIHDNSAYFKQDKYDIIISTSCNCHGVISFMKNNPSV
ncbi:MAG: hypothetical protein BAJALOKI3v1_940012 [Promethearchaeota archaeon]|nr:MAG: hypothetical protein BAJALOKI3v1_940012 [Candidatus Lokiarchaeota archaeon]